MSKKSKKTAPTPQKREASTAAILLSEAGWSNIISAGYTTLKENTEVLTGCRRIADLIASMTIHLMANNDKGGDIRIENELSKKIDVTPNQYTTRFNFIHKVVMDMLVYGDGNAVVVPLTENGLLGDLVPVPASQVSYMSDGYGYKIGINNKWYNPADLLHFVYNPDPEQYWYGKGIKIAAKDVIDTLKQATATKKEFFSNKFNPSIIIKVDGMTEEFSSKEGRQKLLDTYIESSDRNQPWMIPAEQFSVEQIRPLSLNDIALNDSVRLDKQTVAAILNVPAFVLGVGTYTPSEWDNFISAKIRPIAQILQQEMTRKLILNPKWYLKFNVASLYAYDLKSTADVYSNLYVRGLVTGNEVRDKLSMSPKEGLDELVILENYIPLGMIGDQKKLKGDSSDGE